VSVSAAQTPEDVEMVIGEENFIWILDSEKGPNRREM
jgi:hypothetical protein